MTDLAQGFAGWSLELTMTALALALVVRTGRRRSAINEALHELRRPLQALALSGSASGSGGGGVVESSVRLAAAAMDRLDREVNGGARPPVRETVRCESVLRSAVGRWRARVALAGGSLELRWRAGEAAVLGDRGGIEQAIDNLIVNAIEHGGPDIVVDCRCDKGRLRVSVTDRGARPEPPAGGRPSTVVAQLTGRRRHGHGLAVVRRVAAEHRGRFILRRAGAGATALLELPLADGAPGAA